MPSPYSLTLDQLSPEQFLEHYWQKKPLLIRGAIQGFECPIDANELAGLAMEEDVESRIIIEGDPDEPWQVKNGPFDESDFASLPPTHWTLLIQQLDAWVPEIASLKQLFSFIPYWRFDDIMASYAPAGGSVGPHYDQYDVFLFQASGKRHWQVGQLCDEHSPRVQGTALRILENFDTQTEWTLEPGDMLYLPPNVAHHGIGLSNEEGNGDCITLSIGYKAPTHAQIISHFSDYLIEQINPYKIYEDGNLTRPQNPYEITQQALANIRSILVDNISREDQLLKWFGEFTSAPKNDEILGHCEPIDNETLIEALKSGDLLYQNEGSRLFYASQGEISMLFADGECFSVHQSLTECLKLICSSPVLAYEDLSEFIEKTTILELVRDLINQGSFYIATDH